MTNPLGVEPAAGLGDLAQRGNVSGGRAAGREQLEGVRHAGQRGHPRRTHRAPQGRVDHGGVGQQHRPAHRQVRVQHGQAVAVVQRQGRDRPVTGVEAERGGDVDGVGSYALRGEADQLGRAGAARRREQQRQVGVQGVPSGPGPVDDHPPPVPPAGAVVRSPDLGQRVGPAGSGEEDHVSGVEGGEVGDHAVDGRLDLDEHEPPHTGTRPGGRLASHPSGELRVAHLLVPGQQGRCRAVPREHLRAPEGRRGAGPVEYLAHG